MSTYIKRQGGVLVHALPTLKWLSAMAVVLLLIQGLTHFVSDHTTRVREQAHSYIAYRAVSASEYQPSTLDFKLRIFVWPIASRFHAKLEEDFWSILREEQFRIEPIPGKYNGFKYLQEAQSRRSFTSQFLSEPYIHRFLAKHAVSRKEDADLFYVPFYNGYLSEICRMMGAIREVTGQPHTYALCETDSISELLAEVTNSSEWKMSVGRDFIFTCPYNNCYQGSAYVKLKRSIMIGIDNSDQNRVKTLMEEGRSQFKRYPGYQPYLYHNFVGIPMCVNQPDWLVLKSKRKLASFIPKERTTFLYFAGRRGSSKVLRDQLLDGLQDRAGVKFLLLDKNDNTASLAHEENILQTLQSVFCLAPRGSAPVNRRLYESLVGGCIPVILSDLQTLPFQMLLGNYSDFAVIIPEAMPVEEIWRTISSIQSSDIERMQMRLSEIWQYFTFHNSDDEPSAMTLVHAELQIQAALVKQQRMSRYTDSLVLNSNAMQYWTKLGKRGNVLSIN